MYPKAGEVDLGKIPFHEHTKGYEYFFVDSGSLELFVDGKRRVSKPAISCSTSRIRRTASSSTSRPNSEAFSMT